MANSIIAGWANPNNVVYDSGSDTPIIKRHGTSAPEVELFSDMRDSFDDVPTTNVPSVFERARLFDTQKSFLPSTQQRQAPPPPPPPPQNQWTHSQTPPVQPSKQNLFQQDLNDQQLTSSVDRLLERYAPDATPKGTTNSINNHRPPPQVNIVTTRQPPTSSSNNTSTYSTFNRQLPKQISQSETSINTNWQSFTRPPASAAYDSFQPRPSQQQLPQQQAQTSLPLKTTAGNSVQVVPGQLYALDQDPLLELYDRQEPVRAKQQQPPPPPPQRPPFNSTFQMPSSFQPVSDPFTSIFHPTSQHLPHPISASATHLDGTTTNGIKPFDLTNLIQRVQEDYLRQIQPYVSSVKFIEKNQQYGQSLNDIGLTMPMTVHKGFTSQADDLLRHSFGKREKQHSYDHNYPIHSNNGENTDAPSSRHQHHPLTKTQSNESFTSITSTSTGFSDNHDRQSSRNKREKRQYHDQGTSPPPTPNTSSNGMNLRSQLPQSRGKLSPTNTREDKTMTTTNNHPVKLKQARRLPSNASTSSARSSTTSDHGKRSTLNNAYDKPLHTQLDPTQPLNTFATSGPILPPTEVIRANQQELPHSEDIHPVPPTIHSKLGHTSKAQNAQHPSEESDTIGSGSESGTGSDYESEQPAPSARPSDQPQSTARGGNAVVAPAGTPGSAQPSRGAPSRDQGAASTTTPTPSRDAPSTAASAPSRNSAATSQPASTPSRNPPPAPPAAPSRNSAATNQPAATPSRNAPPAAAAAPSRNSAATNQPAATPSRNAPPAAAAAPSRDSAATSQPASTPSRDAQSTAAAAPSRNPAATTQPASTPSRNAPSAAASAPPRSTGPAASNTKSTGSFRFFDRKGGSSIVRAKSSIKDIPSKIGNSLRAASNRLRGKNAD